MKVRFWGTRGSLAKPGPRTVRYGGNTSCVSVETDSGTLLVIDCGTGVHELGQHLLGTRKGPIHGHVLISHTHWDHIQGIPFFTPLFIPGHRWGARSRRPCRLRVPARRRRRAALAVSPPCARRACRSRCGR